MIIMEDLTEYLTDKIPHSELVGTCIFCGCREFRCKFGVAAQIIYSGATPTISIITDCSKIQTYCSICGKRGFTIEP